MDEPAPTMRAYGRHLLICTGGTCAASETGEALAGQVPQLLGERRRLRNPERVKCSMVDCLGVCAGGPIAVVYPDGIWYHHVDAALLERIVREHLLDGRPVAEAIFHRLYPAGQEPVYAPDLRADDRRPTTDDRPGAAEDGGSRMEDRLSDASEMPAASLEDRGWKIEDSHPDTSEMLVSTPDAPSSEDRRLKIEDSSLDTHESQSSTLDSRSSIESTEKRKARRVEVRKRGFKKGLVIVNTGGGKGKTTAALGILLRAWGREMRLGGVQFFKHTGANFGELRAARRMGVELAPVGDGFTWTSRDIDETQAKALHGWEIAQQRIASGSYDIFLLDEFTYLMHFGWLDAREVIAWIVAHKPPALHLLITGRDAPPELIAFADLVTEMREIKHPFRDQGVKAQPGIEF